jgi:tetratricopeptide (TPR) repeat protein
MNSLSIIVTAYNCAPAVRKALESVEASLAHFRRAVPGAAGVRAEVVIVDDGSTDDTYRAVTDFARGRDGWKVVRRACPSSPSCARNAGVRESSGDLLFFLDGDSRFLPPHVAVCWRALTDETLSFLKTGVRPASPGDPQRPGAIEDRAVVNLCVRRPAHDFLGGFPDLHLFSRAGDEFRHEGDATSNVGDLHYNRLLSALFKGGTAAEETVECVRHPASAPDVQAELGEVLFQDRLRRLRRKREAASVAAADLFAQARKAHQAGDLRRAAELYRQVVADDPAHSHAWYLLGIACHGLGQSDEALAHLHRALRHQPGLAEAHNHVGLIFAQAGRLDEALASFRAAARAKPSLAEAHHNAALALLKQNRAAEAAAACREAVKARPDFADAHNTLGLALAAEGLFDEAAASYREALRLQPNHARAQANLAEALRQLGETGSLAALASGPGGAKSAEASNQLGLALMGQGKAEEALPHFREAVQLRPDFAEAHNHLGLALAGLSRPAEAVTSYREAIHLQPDLAQAHHNLGVALRMQGKHAEAEAACREALRLKPDSPEGHNNLGLALLEQRKYEEAGVSLREALRLKPEFAQGYNNLGIIQWRLGNLEDAAASFTQSLRLRPGFPEAYNNLGNVLRDQGRFEEALDCFEKALQLKPDYGDAHWNRSLLWLSLGDYERGWPEYEWRWHLKDFARRGFSQPQWDGAPLDGRTILLHAEQGLGDTLQFVRYAPPIRQRGGKIVLECQGPLVRLLSGLPNIDKIVPKGQPLPPFDVHAPLLSLPTVFGTTLATVPGQVPYVEPDPKLVEQWRQELQALPGFKVGIAWQGSTQYRGDRWRSVPLARFASVAAVPGVTLVSLQKGHGTEQLRDVPFPVFDLAARLDEKAGPFVDTAAVMHGLDLIITSDTAIPHLAGALGVPVWVALPSVPDWRWLLGRDDSPWYPTMRLFRQTTPGDWDEVFGRIAAALRDETGAAGRSAAVRIEMAPGELIDKITILEIKRERIKDAAKLANVRTELDVLNRTRDGALPSSGELERLTAELRSVNEALWELEDRIRECEREGDFGDRFVELARSVYKNNDRRAALKRSINELLGSRLVEEKSYAPYGP